MGILSKQMWEEITRQRLCFIATVRPDGTPNLCPIGTMTVWDEDHLVFAEIRSSRTLENLSQNPVTEINVVDPIARKGFRFRGTATVVTEGKLLEEVVALYQRRGVSSTIHAIVVVKLLEAREIVSPAYESGADEETIRARWKKYWDSVHKAGRPSPTGE